MSYAYKKRTDARTLEEQVLDNQEKIKKLETDGIQGLQGIQGIQGPQGIQGIRGPQGMPGLKGDKGDKGEDGQKIEPYRVSMPATINLINLVKQTYGISELVLGTSYLIQMWPEVEIADDNSGINMTINYANSRTVELPLSAIDRAIMVVIVANYGEGDITTLAVQGYNIAGDSIYTDFDDVPSSTIELSSTPGYDDNAAFSALNNGIAVGPRGEKGDVGDRGSITWLADIPIASVEQINISDLQLATAEDIHPYDYVIGSDGYIASIIGISDPFVMLTVTKTDLKGPQGIQGVQGIQGERGERGPVGPQGIAGMSGSTPYIGSNGNWFVNGSDTGIRALGTPGSPGPQGPQGPQGVQGQSGPQGLTGPQGATGPQGPQGPKGDKGDRGTDGREFQITDTVNSSANLPTPSAVYVGKAYAVGTVAPRDIYVCVYDGSNYIWQNEGPLQGPQGPQGPQGVQGAQGPQGIQGIQGVKGDKGDKGDQGDQGIAATLTIGSVTTGDPGSLAEATMGGTPQARTLNLILPRGAAGPQGVQGIQGPKGDKGDQGIQGIQGIQGPAGTGVVRVDGSPISTPGSSGTISTTTREGFGIKVNVSGTGITGTRINTMLYESTTVAINYSSGGNVKVINLTITKDATGFTITGSWSTGSGTPPSITFTISSVKANL